MFKDERNIINYIVMLCFLSNILVSGVELVIGEERIEPGILFIFEGAVKDHVMPMGFHLSENETNVHIEARANWDSTNIPPGTPPGGFVAYLHITAAIKNQKTGLQTFIDLVPHINLVDNFHYARNISLPGSIYDFYTVTFNIIQPTKIDLALHKDWLDKFGYDLMQPFSTTYKDIYFAEICKSTRK
jgi:hypothetical protein